MWLTRRFATPNMSAGVELAQRIVDAANAANHHPDLLIGYSSLEVRLTTHDTGGLTDLDVNMARTITALIEA